MLTAFSIVNLKPKSNSPGKLIYIIAHNTDEESLVSKEYSWFTADVCTQKKLGFGLGITPKTLTQNPKIFIPKLKIFLGTNV